MSPEKEQILFETFPKIFPNGRNVDPRENLMCFGFECDDGWFDIIYNLCEHIQRRVDNYRMGDREGSWKVGQVRGVQVKEKYGTLRFYTNALYLYNVDDPEKTRRYDELEGIIDHACFLSGKTCEVCGSKGKVRGFGWVKCLCNNCAKELDYPTDDELLNDDTRDL